MWCGAVWWCGVEVESMVDGIKNIQDNESNGFFSMNRSRI